MKNFCKYFLKNADLDSGNIQIGIVSYSTGVHIEFQMNDYSTSQDIMEAIDAIPYRNGSKNTADGLRIMRSQMFTAANGDRDGVPNVILILTDGWSNISSQRTFSDAEQARAKGIHIYSIGIGLRDTRELNDMASEPASENSFNIQDFDELEDVSDQIFQAVCLVKPDVVIKPNRSPVLYGGPVTIECTVKSNIPVKEVTWYRVEGDSRTPIVQDGKQYSGSTVRVSYFTINHANFQDEGTYVCSAENAAGVGSSTNGEVDVTGAPPVVSIPKKEYTEYLGTEVTLECDVVANPPETTVYWRRKDRGQMVDVDTTSSRYSRVSPTSPSLTLTNLDTSDSGMYQCFADNPVGTGQSQQTSLKVLLPITLPISKTTETVATTEKPRKTGYDLVIILDSSVSQEYFDLMKTFTKHLAYKISIDDQEFRVGLLTYSTDSKVQFNLNDYQSSDNVKNAVDKVQNRGGLTNTANAIDTARTQMFTPAHGDRDYARNFIFLITGQDKSFSRTDAWRAAERAETDGIGLYVIGFNINDRDELDEISSHPLSTYQYLIRSERELAEGPHQIYAGLLEMPKTPLPMRPRPVSAITPIGTVFQRTTAYRTASTFPPPKS